MPWTSKQQQFNNKNGNWSSPVWFFFLSSEILVLVEKQHLEKDRKREQN